MIIEEIKKIDTEGKNRPAYLLKCDACKTSFTRYKRFTDKDGLHFCTPKCKNVYEDKSVWLKCEHCSTKFYRSKSRLKLSKSELYYCSRACKDEAQKYEKRIQPAHYGQGISKYRDIAFKHKRKVCERCGYSENEKALDVHHKDRD